MDLNGCVQAHFPCTYVFMLYLKRSIKWCSLFYKKLQKNKSDIKEWRLQRIKYSIGFRAKTLSLCVHVYVCVSVWVCLYVFLYSYRSCICVCEGVVRWCICGCPSCGLDHLVYLCVVCLVSLSLSCISLSYCMCLSVLLSVSLCSVFCLFLPPACVLSMYLSFAFAETENTKHNALINLRSGIYAEASICQRDTSCLAIFVYTVLSWTPSHPNN